MLSKDITSANAIVTTADEYGSTQFVQFSADGAWSQDNYEFLEHRMGVDGHVAVGFTPVEKEITFTFEANSPTLIWLSNMYASMEKLRRPFYQSIVIRVPSIGRTYTLWNCYLTSFKLIPDGARTLEPVEATFTFERVEAQS